MPPTHQLSRPLVVLALGTFIFTLVSILPMRTFFTSHTTYKEDADLEAVSRKLTGASLYEDTDGDGIPAWEEALRGTDPAIRDQLPPQQPDTSSDTLTASYAKNVYALGKYLSASGITDADTTSSLYSQAAQEELAKISPRVYTLKDLTVSQDTSKKALTAYGNLIAQKTISTLRATQGDDEVELMSTYTKTKNSMYLDRIKNKLAVLKKYEAFLLSTPVPYSATIQHLTVINRVSEYTSRLENLTMMQEDPFRAFLGVRGYIASLQTLLNSINLFKDFFESEDIIFVTSDPGNIFNKGILIQ